MNIQDERRVTDILENLIAEEAAKNLQKSIDYDVLCELMIPFGYTAVQIEYSNEKRWIDVMAWVDSNRIDDYREHKGRWLFKSEQDAIMFKLRWV